MTTDLQQMNMFFNDPPPSSESDKRKGKQAVNKVRKAKGQLPIAEGVIERVREAPFYANGPIIGELEVVEGRPTMEVMVEGRPHKVQVFDMRVMEWVAIPEDQVAAMEARVRRYAHGDRSIERRMHLTNESHQPKVHLEDLVYDGPSLWEDEDANTA